MFDSHPKKSINLDVDNIKKETKNMYMHIYIYVASNQNTQK